MKPNSLRIVKMLLLLALICTMTLYGTTEGFKGAANANSVAAEKAAAEKAAKAAAEAQKLAAVKASAAAFAAAQAAAKKQK